MNSDAVRVASTREPNGDAENDGSRTVRGRSLVDDRAPGRSVSLAVNGVMIGSFGFATGEAPNAALQISSKFYRKKILSFPKIAKQTLNEIEEQLRETVKSKLTKSSHSQSSRK